MCGRFNATFDSGVKKLYTRLKINKVIDKPINKRFVKAADNISIVRNKGNTRVVERALWWLLLDKTEGGFTPSKYTSFNTRYNKLNTPRSAGYQAYRQSRCVIAIKGFGETEFKNKKPIHYFDIQAEEGGLLLGGLCKDWVNKQTGEVTSSCSVITIPPHEKLRHIHSKAMPLILSQDDNVIDNWLNNDLTNIEQFEPLLHPKIPQNLIAQKIDKPMSYNSIGNSEFIEKDYSTND